MMARAAKPAGTEPDLVVAIEPYCTVVDGIDVFVKVGDVLEVTDPARRDPYVVPFGSTAPEIRRHRAKHGLGIR
jgi:hypothetical protein